MHTAKAYDSLSQQSRAVLTAKTGWLLFLVQRALCRVERSGDRMGLQDLEDSRAFVRDEFRHHALTHYKKKSQAAGQ